MADIGKALVQLQQESQRARRRLQMLDKVIAALRPLVGQSNSSTRVTSSRVARISTAGRQRIAAAQRARWAKWKAGQQQKAA